MSGWEGVILCIIIGDAHQFLGYCLIDLNTYLKRRINRQFSVDIMRISMAENWF